ncbi:MAG: TetR/AcrR family transcriptional regulator C-terminal domain-containing protein [Firmicutes bacterium]|nr:TetR/AcrR family transcriptional regulator C-terminal domain-containing protein [Bacillota bacterium]
MIRQTTKDILAESFLELAEKKRIDKITITEITNNCSMSQPTFYNHFKDKYDLIVWIHTSRVEKIMAKIGAKDYIWKDTLLEGAKYYYQNKNYIANALKHTGGQDSFINYVRHTNVEVLVKEVRKKIMTEYIPEEIYGMIKVYVYGTVQYMLEWLLNGAKQSPEEVSLIWEKSLPEPLKQYLYPDYKNIL